MAARPTSRLRNPNSGLLLLEVKDWHLDSILDANKFEVELATMKGQIKEWSPFEQARAYMLDVLRGIERDDQLIFPSDHRFKGRPILPFGFGVVFTNITRKQFSATNLRDVFLEDRCVFKDEMVESADPEEFRTRIWSVEP